MLHERVLVRRIALVVGLATLVAGTFLPWLRSGRVDRNSYAAGDALRGIEQLPVVVGAALDAWPFLALLCAVAAAAVLLGRPLPGLVIGAVVAAVAGSVAGFVLAKSSNSLVRPVFTGPIVTLTGSCLVLVIVLASLLGDSSSRR